MLLDLGHDVCHTIDVAGHVWSGSMNMTASVTAITRKHISIDKSTNMM
jgi:hypothetical protein